MKKIGLVGGLGPASTPDYYMGIINGCRQKAGENAYPEILIYSINMIEMISFIEQDHWDEVVDLLANAIDKLSVAGADFAAIASNTPHLVFDEICARSPIPLLNIVAETCKHISTMGYQRILAIGTLFTMKSGLYSEPLKKFGVTPLLPSEQDQEKIYSLFYPNLENGIVVAEDKEKMLELLSVIIEEQDADSLLLGCTELPLMIRPGDLPIPLIDTMQIHIGSIVAFALD